MPGKLADLSFRLKSIGSWDFLPALGVDEKGFIRVACEGILSIFRILGVDDFGVDASLLVTADGTRVHQLNLKKYMRRSYTFIVCCGKLINYDPK